MTRSALRLTASFAALASLQLSPVAFAADQTTGDAPAEAAPQDSAADDNGLTEIVVTATKRETNLQKTPISISVMGAEVIAERKVQSLLDLADGGVPSLRVATFEARQSALTIGIRGIVPLDANQPAREQGVGIYIDGVYLGRQHGLNASLFDVERIEVLKGPQGTLFGRNTEGGALSMVSKAPSGKFGGRVDGGVGNLGAYNGSFHLDLPAVAGFSIKLDGVLQHQDEITKNPLAGQAGWGLYNRKGGRIAVRWQPTDSITNDFAYDVAKDENTPFYSQLLNYDPNNCRSLNGGATNSTTVTPVAIPAGSACVAPGTAFTAVSGTVRALLPGVVVNGDTLMRDADIGVPQQVSIDRTHGFHNTFKWKVSPELELRSITAWRGVDVEQWDNSGGAHRVPVVAPGTGGSFSRYSLADLRQRQFSQELQAVGSIGNIDYVAGLYYFNEHVSDDAATPSSVAISGYTTAGQTTGYTYTPLTFCAGGAAVAGTVGPATNGCGTIDRASEVFSKSYAAYGQVTWNANDKLHITVGGRYTNDKKKGVLHWSRGVNYDARPDLALLNGYVALDKSWNRFNPMATIAYDVNSDTHVYAKYASGYRAGGASSRTANYAAFNPEDVKSFEVGLKADLWDRRARFNLAAYIMNRKGSQVDLSTIQPATNAAGVVSSFNNLVTFNAPGNTKIRGVEADLTVKPATGLTLSASYAYTYTDVPLVPVTYTEFKPDGTVNTVGGVPVTTTVNQKFYIVYTPRNAAGGSMDYELPIGGGDAKVKFHLDANYADATQSFDQFATKADGSFIVNGRLSLAGIGLGDGGQKLTVGIWARNLFNEQHVYRRDPSNSIPQVQSNRAANTTVANLLTVGNIGNTLGDYGNFNVPRAIGVDAAIKF